MATIEYWIQLENRPWDACPNPRSVDRLTGKSIKETTGKDPVNVTLTSPGTGASHVQKMFAPLRDTEGKVMDALIFRRYKPPKKPDQSDAWTVPDDRKVNPWDLNERDPTDSGTMGTIPGPVIECNVGDSVIVHFRNHDERSKTVVDSKKVCFDLGFGMGEVCFPMPVIKQEPLPMEMRCHSMHPHGFVFAPSSDGAYPLSPPDASQPIPPSEAAAWSAVPGFTGKFKKGDRVPPGGTFVYRWNTAGWPTTSGAWLYHDHSICDMENINLGAIGVIVIHNPNDPLNEVDIRDPADPAKGLPEFLPGGSLNGSPIVNNCFPLAKFPKEFAFQNLRILPHDLEGLGEMEPAEHGAMRMSPAKATVRHDTRSRMKAKHTARAAETHAKVEIHEARPERVVRRGDLLLELDASLKIIDAICLPHYRTPPAKALFLQLFHELTGAPGMAINGRVFLGQTPTMVAGRETRMRFGVVGMGSQAHTFHIHGHRWILPGPQGNTPPAIQTSPQVQPVSQFEDTRIFGPANSFVFTIDEKSGSFMRAGGPSPDDPLGEWHMHCHVLSHMMTGMMGSLMVIKGGELATALPVGVPCEDMEMDGGGGETPAPETIVTIDMKDAMFMPTTKTVAKGSKIKFVNKDAFPHSVVWDTGGSPANSPTINAAGTAGDTWTSAAMNTAGTFAYHCGFHGSPGSGMHGSITVNP